MDTADSAWLCTQAMASADDQTDDEKDKLNNVCIYLFVNIISQEER